MYPLLTDRPTKFLSFTCPLKVLIQQPVSTDHNFSSLSVELNREREKVKIQDIIQEREGESKGGREEYTYADTSSFSLKN